MSDPTAPGAVAIWLDGLSSQPVRAVARTKAIVVGCIEPGLPRFPPFLEQLSGTSRRSSLNPVVVRIAAIRITFESSHYGLVGLVENRTEEAVGKDGGRGCRLYDFID